VETPAEPPQRPPQSPDFILGEVEFPVPAASGQPLEELGPRERRRRPRSASALPGTLPPALLRGTDPVLRWGPVALLAFAPLAWGSVEAWSEMVVVAGAAALGAVWLLRLALYPERLAAERSARSHSRSWSAGLHLPLAAVAAVMLVQLAPLGRLAAALSPTGAEIQRQAGLASGALTLSLARPQTLRALAQLTAFGLLFFAVRDALPGRAESRRLAVACVVLGFAHALGGILWHYQSTGRAYWSPGAGGVSFGPYINRNHFACLMGMSIPLGIGLLLSLGQRRRTAALAPGTTGAGAVRRREEAGRSQRFLFGFLVVVMGGALGLSLSRGGIVSTLGALGALAVGVGARRTTRGQLWKVAAAVAAALAFTVWLAAGPLLDRLGTLAGLFTNEAVTAPRTVIWGDTVRMAADFPLFGTGFGAFAEVYPRYQTGYAGGFVRHAHNDWVQLLAEGGLAGSLAVLVLLGAYLAAAKKLLGRRRDREAIFLGLGGLCGLLAFLLHSFTEFNAHIPANALWFTVLAALTLKALASRMDAEA
jgi:hypothetical protein